MDHVIWSRRFHQLPDEDLGGRLDESYGHFVRHFGRPVGFSSPGFYSDERVMALLDRLGFLYNGDAIGGEPHRATADGRALRHWTIPVTLSGPRTIPFLEYHGARSTPEAEVMRLLDEHLEAHDEVILYGHPCYEGVREARPAQGVRARGRARVPVRHHADARRATASRARRPMIRVLSVFGTRPEAIKMAPGRPRPARRAGGASRA